MNNNYQNILSNLYFEENNKHLLSKKHKDWLLYQHSLTLKLQQYYTNITVKVISQKWVSDTNFDIPIWQRDILLMGDNTEIIFARTTLPQATINNVAHDILTLGNKSIGLWLFPQNPERTHLEWTQDPETELYARRSTLLLKGYPLEITELFLENFTFPIN
ncbi:chorismate lyase [Pasteurella atlantica]|uniref:Chorismate lyase n=2 Tax=Pasteurellaceae TaxID=712 RepID=A0ACC6HLI3_9PAST|nr:chorismate lyase [Pasteurella atlantica]MDP8034131.1 chorismate lyase [Pasteurella atlantica]MDP8036090.1 chorismate lyase [Pasteurella atlantica]MDP8038040.1 chorismate lyase [Pasteurella atlantica]MDP8048369.1 chorismate lyase [Pasteurella atlantica]MDP8050352.1 chorismate lyase [Pasteurella atlantica]